MAAMTSLAAVLGAGASVWGVARQAELQRKQNRAQADATAQQEQARQQELTADRAADRAARAQALARTVAATRARLAAGGLSPDEGSAAAIAGGLRQEAAAAEGTSEEAFRARLARGRTSLLNPDGTLTALLQSGRTLGLAARSLLD